MGPTQQPDLQGCPGARPSRPLLAAIGLFSGLVLLLETVLFRLLEYIHDFYAATMVVAFAVLGLGLGSWLAAKVRLESVRLFVVCALISTASLLVASVVLVAAPSRLLAAVVLPPVFVGPALFVASAFRLYRADLAYLADMVGIFCGLGLTVLLYLTCRSETIILLMLVLVPLLGLVVHIAGSRPTPEGGGAPRRRLPVVVLTLLGVLCAGMLVHHLATDSLNPLRLVRYEGWDVPRAKAFKRVRDDFEVRSYDNLVGRIDVIQRRERYWLVAYNGFGNDHFSRSRVRSYEKRWKGERWPSTDVRVVYGLVEEPRVFVIGSAAQGIIKTVQRLTPPERITPVEINPAILRVMTRDYARESRHAYKRLEPVQGNALALLLDPERRPDVITLINVHSNRTISYRGAPDPLHTVESYELALSRLTDDGYLLFEERPMDPRGVLAQYRQVVTLWRALEALGVEDPGRHFLLYHWQSRGARVLPGGPSYYVSFIVTRQPLQGDRLRRAEEWLTYVEEDRAGESGFERLWVAGRASDPGYAQLFAMLRSGDFTALESKEQFDPTPATDDRPFLSTSTRDTPRLRRLLVTAGVASIALWLLLSLGLRGAPGVGSLNLFNALIGLGYFGVEIVLFQAHQALFLSPAVALVFVLGLLLLSSGLGGYLGARLPLGLSLALLVPLALGGLLLPRWLLGVGVPFVAVKAFCVALVCVTGFLMGTWFPRGLALARRAGLEEHIPSLFAVNCVFGSLATVATLYLAVHIGYRSTLFAALGAYLLALVTLAVCRRRMRLT